jgi:TPR repeat protein
MRRNPQAMARLKALAAEGNLSAKCFYGRFAWRGDRQSFDWRETLPYIIDAADGGHPSCTGAFASFLRSDHPLPGQYESWIRIQRDPQARTVKALELEEQAARAGDLGSQSRLALTYELGKDVPRDYGRARCWASIATRTSGRAPYVMNKAIGLEQSIRWAVAREHYDVSSIKKYREDSWCTEVTTE